MSAHNGLTDSFHIRSIRRSPAKAPRRQVDSDVLLFPLRLSAFAGNSPHRFQTSSLPNNASACSSTLSTLNPKFLSATSPGADAPKRSKQITSPASPTYRSQPCRTPASIANRALTDGGKTSSRYSFDSASNSSQQGMETTRVGT